MSINQIDLYSFFLGAGYMKTTVAEFSPITAIFRGYDYEQVKTAVEILLHSEIHAVEITLNRGDSKETIRKIVKEYGAEIAVGAGTVQTKEDLQDVIGLGVDFILAPSMFTKEMIQICKANNVLSVPGAFSPTEIYQSMQNGADIVKVFPATVLGARYITDIIAPLGNLPMMVVGGINAENVAVYRNAGANYAGIASGIFKKEDLFAKNKAGLQKSLQYFESWSRRD